MKALISVFFILVLSGCVSEPVHDEIVDILPPMGNSAYAELISEHTREDKQYAGLYNTYQVAATILNSKVRAAVLQRKGHFLQWDIAKARQQREKVFQEMSSEAMFFVSMYTPRRDHNDLAKPDTMWKVYLDSNGVRYKGTVSIRNKIQYSRLLHEFPFHSRFSRGYYIRFRVPMSAVETQRAKLTIASSLGQSTFEFPALK